MSSSTFDCEYRYQPDTGEIESIVVFRSSITGLRAIVSQIEGPLVNGYFALATEACNDDGSSQNDGCPHTLEHLVFLGSRDYPYKGILDAIANRCLAQGTNAWTDTDHTCYTITTAGWEGFRNLLPVYLDHILYPLITASGFQTEVHHIDGEGHDAGVVYCEMQARQNTEESLCDLRMMQLCFKGTGFASETGGLIQDIRSLDVETVRAFHSKMYRAENLCIIVSGRVDETELLHTLMTFDSKIVATSNVAQRIRRPWTQHCIQPISVNIVEHVQFPSQHESVGLVSVGWQGPQWNDTITKIALILLWRYLTETPLSPLQQEFVECEPALCSSVEHSLTEYSTSLSKCVFTDARADSLEFFETKLFVAVEKAINKMNLARLHLILDKVLREQLSILEETPHLFACTKSIEIFLYADSAFEIKNEFCIESHIRKLKTYPVNFWHQLARRYIIENSHVTIIGVPSAATAIKFASQEAERVTAQIASYGSKGLLQCANALHEAELENSAIIPDSILQQFAVPDANQVSEFRIENSRCADLGNTKFAAVSRFACDSDAPILHVADCRSRFCELRALLDASRLCSKQRALLPIFLDIIFESDIITHCNSSDSNKQNERIDFKAVVSHLEALTVSYKAHIGFQDTSMFCPGSFPELISVLIRVNDDKAHEAVVWLRNILVGVQFNIERIRVAVQRLLNSIPTLKRKGQVIARTAVNKLHFTSQSNYNALNVFEQQSVLEAVLMRLEQEPAALCNDLYALQSQLVDTVSFFIVLNGSRQNISALLDTFKTEFPSTFERHHHHHHHHVVNESQFLQAVPIELSRNKLRAVVATTTSPSTAVLLTVMGLESSYLFRTTMCLPEQYEHDDMAPLLLVIEYLTALEGAFWKRIRGLGLAYGYGIDADVESGLLSFHLSRSTNIGAAFVEAQQCIDNLITHGFSKIQIEAARSSLSFELVSGASTLTLAANQLLLERLKRIAPGYTKRMLCRIHDCTIPAMQSVLTRYIVPLFTLTDFTNSDDAIIASSLVVSTGDNMADDIVTFFADSFDVTLVKQTSDEFFL